MKRRGSIEAVNESRYSGLREDVRRFCKQLDDILINEYNVILNDDELKTACVVAYSGKNILLVGPPGTGKTTFAKALSKVSRKPYYRVTVYPDMDVVDIYGDWDYRRQLLAIQSGKKLEDVYTREFFIPGPAMKALEDNGILHVDEVNRSDESVQNALLELAEEKQITIPMLGTVKGNIQIVGTMNEGDIGTTELSSAFRRRFVLVRFSHPNKESFMKALEKKYGKDIIEKINKALEKLVESYSGGGRE